MTPTGGGEVDTGAPLDVESSWDTAVDGGEGKS